MPDGVDAALDGTYRVSLADGTEVEVRPGWAHVVDEVATWTPERVEEVAGIDADLLRRLARAYAAESPAAILMGGGSNHWYHGDLTGRAFALLATVTGNIGRSGGGFSV
jgi:nitrate reductase / nitrite oxidoreductase, alpha subunit